MFRTNALWLNMANNYEKWSSHPLQLARVNSYLQGMTLGDMPSPNVHSFSTGAAHQGDHQQSKHHQHRECHLKISMLTSWMLAASFEALFMWFMDLHSLDS